MENREINYERMSELWKEFSFHYDQMHAFYHDAVAGFVWFKEKVASDQEIERARYQGFDLDTNEFWDSKRLEYGKIFNQEYVASGLHVGTVKEAKARNEPEGSNFKTLANVCSVYFYAYWESYFRREYCMAKRHHGCTCEELREHASFDLWGDIRLLRNSIVHHQEVALDDINNCKLIKLFQPGDPISISPQHMRGIFHLLYQFRNSLHAESIRKVLIKIPERRRWPQ